ncbi:MAG: glycosyltransferase family 87 protein [Bdellovibrionota bacterium]
MKPTPRTALLASAASIAGIVGVALIIGTGTFWAFTRGANDFQVFYAAWKLALSGWGSELYSATPDRFLYAPGFAWLFSPIALLPKSQALAFWCLAKAFALGLVLRKLASHLRYSRQLWSLGVACWGLILVARPLLIDFQYGQVNSFILAFAVWALLGHFDRHQPYWVDFGRWFLLGIGAVAKLLALPLLVVPWAVTHGIFRKRLQLERVGSIAGFAITLGIPLLFERGHGTWVLFRHWQEALIAKGLPLESHNQSFIAFLFHYFSGAPTHIIADARSMAFGVNWLSSDTILLLSSAWTLLTLGFALGWLVSGSNKAPLRWVAVAIGLLIVPSHLVWKPYFVTSLPLAVLAVHQTIRNRSAWGWALLVFLFTMLNLTGFDFVGRDWGAHFEAASLFLLMHLCLLAYVLTGEAA